MTMFESTWRDVRYAARILRKSPAWTLTAVLTLALAIGVNTAVFSIVDGVLLEPLPYPHPGNLALVSRAVRAASQEATGHAVDGRTWELVRDRAGSVDAASFSTWATGVNLIATGRSDRPRFVQQQRVGAGFFRVLGVAPELGREFTADEDRAGGPPAVILSAELWRLAFGADRGVVGRTVVLRGEPHTVVGVMPGRFRSSARADLWTPLRPSTTGEGGGENYHVLVRVRGDADWPQAVSEVARAGDELQRERPLTAGREISFSLMPLQRGLTESLRQPLVILWAAVGIVLLVACVNLAGLLIARGAARTREIATRMALGSGAQRRTPADARGSRHACGRRRHPRHCGRVPGARRHAFARRRYL